MMIDMGMTTITRLREKAAQCRELVRKASSDGVASELEKLASDYDKDAARLEMMGPDSMKAFFH